MFSGSRRPHAEYNHIVPDGIHILFLPQCLRLNGLAAHRMADQIPVYFQKCIIIAFHAHLDCIIHILFLNLVSPFR